VKGDCKVIDGQGTLSDASATQTERLSTIKLINDVTLAEKPRSHPTSGRLPNSLDVRVLFVVRSTYGLWHLANTCRRVPYSYALKAAHS
jgi:hypothetical protein